jgi:hypothetical protein
MTSRRSFDDEEEKCTTPDQSRDNFKYFRKISVIEAIHDSREEWERKLGDLVGQIDRSPKTTPEFRDTVGSTSRGIEKSPEVLIMQGASGPHFQPALVRAFDAAAN